MVSVLESISGAVDCRPGLRAGEAEPHEKMLLQNSWKNPNSHFDSDRLAAWTGLCPTCGSNVEKLFCAWQPWFYELQWNCTDWNKSFQTSLRAGEKANREGGKESEVRGRFRLGKWVLLAMLKDQKAKLKTRGYDFW